MEYVLIFHQAKFSTSASEASADGFAVFWNLKFKDLLK